MRTGFAESVYLLAVFKVVGSVIINGRDIRSNELYTCIGSTTPGQDAARGDGLISSLI